MQPGEPDIVAGFFSAVDDTHSVSGAQLWSDGKVSSVLWF